MASAAALGAVGRGFKSLYSDLFFMFVWDPSPILFTLPYVERDVRIYGLLFALGFVCGYYILRRSLSNLFNDREKGRKVADQLTSYSVVGCIVGARLGHMLFYDWNYFIHNPLRVFAFWESGLASHGGALGVLIAFLIYWKRSKLPLSFLKFFDLFVVPVALVGFFIRMGNFFNQEILGNATSMPWGIIFGSAIDGGNDFPRHPVQLYEALFYLGIFCLLYRLKKKPEGFTSGLFLVLVFSSRFFLEFLKSSQGGIFDDFVLQTGQILSLPFITWGIYLMMKSRHRVLSSNLL